MAKLSLRKKHFSKDRGSKQLLAGIFLHGKINFQLRCDSKSLKKERFAEKPCEVATVASQEIVYIKGNVALTNRSFLKWQEYSTRQHYNNTATYNNISYKT